MGRARLGLWVAVFGMHLAIGIVPPVAAQSETAEDGGEPTSLLEALGQGEAKVSLRYRFENVDEAAFEKEAHSSTLRTTLGYTTGRYHGLALHLEAENVTEIGTERQFANRGAGSLGNGVTDRPVVADPELTEMHQAYLSYQRRGFSASAGIQALSHGDQRFIGPVGWRQNHQSFDTVRLVGKPSERFELTYAYLDNVHRIFGDNQPMTSHFLNGDLRLPFGKLALYGLELDYEQLAASGLSTRTLGAELTGKRDVGAGSLVFEAEVARQSEAGDNPAEVDAGYGHFMVGGTRGAFTLEVGLEVLEGNPEDGRFTTPLATLHKWNGWADKFLATPTNGLEDLYLDVGGQHGAHSWRAVYHDFSPESGGGDYGSEVDLQWTYRTRWAQVFGVKAAFYSSDGHSSDTDKLWLWTAFAF